MGALLLAAQLFFSLAWTDTANNEQGFNIERGAATAGPFSQIAQTATDITTYVDGPLLPNTQYCYRVNAYNQAGVSGYSNVACDTTPALPSDPNSLVIKLQVK